MYVRDIKPGVIELRLVGYDVLRKVRMPRRIDGGLLRVPVALREDATAFVRDYRAVPHELVLGATLSGKSSEKAALIYQHSDDDRQQEVAAGLDTTVRKARAAAAGRAPDKPSGTNLARGE